jgi:hypothetical protein
MYSITIMWELSIGKGWNHFIPELIPNQIKLMVKVKKIMYNRSDFKLLSIYY